MIDEAVKTGVLARRFLSVLLVLLAVSLAGCEQEISSISSKYRCNAEQLKLVAIEVSICSETGYIDSYCFDVAKSTICDEIKTTVQAN